MRGLIIKSSGSAYGVRLDDGRTIEAHVKGNFRIKGIRSTNPVAVGDHVQVEQLADGTNWIISIEDRRNYIVRKSTNLSKQSHILAANVDQVALIVTVNHPKTSTTFIDRFLATCEAYRVPAVLIFNKIDLYDEADNEELDYLRLLYDNLGYRTYAISAKSLLFLNRGRSGEDLSSLPEQGGAGWVSLFSGKTTLLSGNSGVGKSTLLNALLGEERARTGVISDVHDQGKHTTTFSEMYFLPQAASAVIDTPGIRGFGTFDFEKEEVSHYFREIFAKSADCRFGNCLHQGEPGCAVVPAVESGAIAYSRFESYLSLLGDCDEGKYR